VEIFDDGSALASLCEQSDLEIFVQQQQQQRGLGTLLHWFIFYLGHLDTDD